RLQPESNTTDVHRPTRLFLLAPGPSASTELLDRLAPILLWGDGVTPGLLTSASTRYPSLVLNTDLLASVADFLHQPLPPGAVGRPMQTDDRQGDAARGRRGEGTIGRQA